MREDVGQMYIKTAFTDVKGQESPVSTDVRSPLFRVKGDPLSPEQTQLGKSFRTSVPSLILDLDARRQGSDESQ